MPQKAFTNSDPKLAYLDGLNIRFRGTARLMCSPIFAGAAFSAVITSVLCNHYLPEYAHIGFASQLVVNTVFVGPETYKTLGHIIKADDMVLFDKSGNLGEVGQVEKLLADKFLNDTKNGLKGVTILFGLSAVFMVLPSLMVLQPQSEGFSGLWNIMSYCSGGGAVAACLSHLSNVALSAYISNRLRSGRWKLTGPTGDSFRQSDNMPEGLLQLVSFGRTKLTMPALG